MGSERQRAVRLCLQSFQRLFGPEALARESRDAWHAFLDQVDYLVGVGCDVEGQFIRELLRRASQLPIACNEAQLAARLKGAIERLELIPWLPEAAASSRKLGYRLYLVRHGESTGNIEKRLQGVRIGGALTQRGVNQSRRTAGYLWDAHRDLGHGRATLVSSTVSRAMASAEPIADRLECAVLPDPRLAELDFGDWSGRSFGALGNDAGYQAWMKDQWVVAAPGGESLFEVRTRTFEALAFHLSSANLVDTSLILVTHFFPLIALYSVLVPGEVVRFNNSSVTCLELDGRHVWRKISVNHTAHLGDETSTPVGYV